VKIFLSHSGEASQAIAEALAEWLPKVIQAVRPWVSSSSIDKGTRWSTEVAKELEANGFGILCLTPENVEAPWIMFEAGALSKIVQTSRVCPYLLGMEPSELRGPLVQFQAARAKESETFELLRVINGGLGDARLSDSQLTDAFETYWPRLESRLKEISQGAVFSKERDQPTRSAQDMLTELLELVRARERRWAQEEERRSLLASEVEQEVEQPLAHEVASIPRYFKGERVEHRRFGKGTVLGLSGKGRDLKVRVEFADPEVGTKWLLVAYAGLEHVWDDDDETTP
jgi:hypothetical protein